MLFGIIFMFQNQECNPPNDSPSIQTNRLIGIITRDHGLDNSPTFFDKKTGKEYP